MYINGGEQWVGICDHCSWQCQFTRRWEWPISLLLLFFPFLLLFILNCLYLNSRGFFSPFPLLYFPLLPTLLGRGKGRGGSEWAAAWSKLLTGVKPWQQFCPFFRNSANWFFHSSAHCQIPALSLTTYSHFQIAVTKNLGSGKPWFSYAILPFNSANCLQSLAWNGILGGCFIIFISFSTNLLN